MFKILLHFASPTNLNLKDTLLHILCSDEKFSGKYLRLLLKFCRNIDIDLRDNYRNTYLYLLYSNLGINEAYLQLSLNLHKED